jgi:hypothetical protein
MATDIMEAADLTVPAADRDDGFAEQVETVIVARVRHVVAVTYQLPAGAEDRALLEFEEVGVAIDPRWQTDRGVVGLRG